MEQRRTRYEPNTTHSHHTPEDMLFHFSYPSTTRQESPESYVSSTSDAAGHPSIVPPSYRYTVPGDGYSQSPPRALRSGDAYLMSGYAPPFFPSQGEVEWPSGQPTLYHSQSPPSDTPANIPRCPSLRGRVEYIPTWLAGQPSDAPPTRRTAGVTAPSFEHSGMARSYEPQHTYPAAYERSQIPVWRELEQSGEIRRQEMDARVSRADYVRLPSNPPTSRGSQSSGSAHSFSSGGATTDSFGGQDVAGTCEFCGRRELLSTLKDHWLKCPYRATRPSRRGVWIHQ
jgi:hypothetical protein